MGRDSGRLREEVRKRLQECGAIAVGFAKAGPVDSRILDAFDRWIARGDYAGMDYMTNYREIRGDTRLLLDGARTVISMAFPYRTDEVRSPDLPYIASYAFLPDYHKWIRKAIRNSHIDDLLGREHQDWRICVDSAPILERYWAQQCGIAFMGINGAAIVPEVGCEVFLAEIISTHDFECDVPLIAKCNACKACIEACPTGALKTEGPDCNLCLSYLTIEHKGEWTDPRHLQAIRTKAGSNTLFGCDRCFSVCPHNNQKITARIKPIAEVLTYTAGPPPKGSSLTRSQKLKNQKGRSC